MVKIVHLYYYLEQTMFTVKYFSFLEAESSFEGSPTKRFKRQHTTLSK